MRIVCTAKLANTTVGHVDHAMAYAVGLQRLGHEVVVMDHVGRARCTDGSGRPVDFDAWSGRAHFEAINRRYGLWPRSCLIGWDRRTHGLRWEAATRFAASADLLIVRSGKIHKLPEIFEAPRRRAFLDGNPGQTQADHAAGSPDAEPLERFDLHFTLGLNLGEADCPIPTCGFDWHRLPRPVDFALWPRSRHDDGPFTTVSTWKGRATFALDGIDAGDKADNWARYLPMPRLTGRPMAIAMTLRESDAEARARFASAGWILSDPAGLRTLDDYRAFIARSRGEFSVAHDRYVASRSGWFSDRTAVYLASGKPAVVQSTGFERHLPTGEGLLTFRTPEEARDRIAAIDAAPARHADAARDLAERCFGAERVLGRLVELARAEVRPRTVERTGPRSEPRHGT